MPEVVFTLARAARKLGGDRYEAPLAGQDKPFVIYIPQCFSRTLNGPIETLIVTIEEGPRPDSFKEV